ncbi:MAG: PilZ domain-containing protein [Candidatus Hydrogenedentes bacterium]|nr:PilZ domain-containing protein [Candidatus Hydrogenedentota bacterium]
MSRPLPFELGSATDPVFWLIVGALFVLGIAAVLLEYHRRRHSRRVQIIAEQKLVDEISAEKQLDAGEKKALRRLIDAYFPQTPLAVVKDRSVFDQAVQQEIQAVESKKDERLLRQTGLVLRSVREKLDFQYVPMGQPISSTRELYEGQIVWLGKEEEPLRWYECAVSAVDEAFLHVTVIGEQAGQALPFKLGETLRCRLWREDDARYIFSVRLTSCSGDPVTCTLRHTSDLNRMQAREYYRIHYTQDAELDLLHSREPAEAEVQQEPRIVAKWPAHFVSLSAGGFAVVTQKPLPPNILVKIVVELPGEQPFEAQARTVGGETLHGERHLIRAQFTDITEEKRDLIAHYVSLRQQPNLAQSLEQTTDRRE